MAMSWGWAAVTMALVIAIQRALQSVFDRNLPRNPARAVVDGAEVLGALLIGGAQLAGTVTDGDLAVDAQWVAIHAALGCVMMSIAGRLGVRTVLRGRLAEEIARGNVPAAVVAAGHTVAAGVIAARCLYGHGWGETGIALVAFVAACAVLHGLTALFRVLTSYDDVEEIIDENAAAALSYAGVTVALGIVVGHAVHGPFAGIEDSLRAFGTVIGLALALYPVRQLIVQCVFLGARPTLRGGRIDDGISHDRDIGLGFLEAATYVGTALMIGAAT